MWPYSVDSQSHGLPHILQTPFAAANTPRSVIDLSNSTPCLRALLRWLWSWSRFDQVFRLHLYEHVWRVSETDSNSAPQTLHVFRSSSRLPRVWPRRFMRSVIVLLLTPYFSASA